jgi:hypothetical protein
VSAAAAPLDAMGRDGTLLLKRGCYFAGLRRTPALKPRLARLTAAAALKLGDRHARRRQAGSAGKARRCQVDQRLALGLPVARGAGRPQRLGPDRERRGPTLIVELELDSNLLQNLPQPDPHEFSVAGAADGRPLPERTSTNR